MAHIGVTQGLRRVYGRVYGLGVYSQEERIKCTRQWKTRWNWVCLGDTGTVTNMMVPFHCRVPQTGFKYL